MSLLVLRLLTLLMSNSTVSPLTGELAAAPAVVTQLLALQAVDVCPFHAVVTALAATGYASAAARIVTVLSCFLMRFNLV